MSEIINKYRIFCKTESKFVETSSTFPPTKCRNNDAHEVNPNSIQQLSSGKVSNMIVTNLASTELTCINDATIGGSLKIAGSDPLYSIKDWTSWASVSLDSNVNLSTVMCQYCSTNKTVIIQYVLSLTFTAAALSARISLPSEHTVAKSVGNTAMYTKHSGSNLFVTQKLNKFAIQTTGSSVGQIETDHNTSTLLFKLNKFLPGTWTTSGSFTYELI